MLVNTLKNTIFPSLLMRLPISPWTLNLPWFDPVECELFMDVLDFIKVEDVSADGLSRSVRVLLRDLGIEEK